MQTLRCKDMDLDQREQGLQHHRAGTDLVGRSRPGIDALAPVALALPVRRLMLTGLPEQDHRQEIRPGEAAWRLM